VSKILPRLNPFIPYLRDAYLLLNEALSHQAEQPEFAGTLSRSSTFHILAALHAAANSSLWSEDQQLYETATLAYKFEMYLRIIRGGQLDDVDIAILHELEIVSQILMNPQVAQARDFPHPEKKNLIEFERTPVKKMSHDASHWVPAYSGTCLGLGVSFLGRYYRGRCGFDCDKIEILFGTHAHNTDRYATGFDESLLRTLRDERDTLLTNEEFLELMASERYKVPAEDFALSLFDGCPGFE
jgi:hypothetical protein